MNFEEAKKIGQPVVKVSWIEPNIANRIEAHLRGLIPEAFEVPGVWVTGSNVWRFVYGDVPRPYSDIDIIVVEGKEHGPTRRERLYAKVRVTAVAPTQPSLAGRSIDQVDLHGMKHFTENGRTIDMWDAVDNDVVATLREYPEHSHAHCRAAYCPHDGTLIILPNSQAK